MREEDYLIAIIKKCVLEYIKCFYKLILDFKTKFKA